MRQIVLCSRYCAAAKVLEPLLQRIRRRTHRSQIRTIVLTTASYSDQPFLSHRETFATLRNQGCDIRLIDIGHQPYDFISDSIDWADMLVVTGGNTFKLVASVTPQLIKLITRAVNERGLLYVGESAGAVIASPDVRYIAYMDSRFYYRIYRVAHWMHTRVGYNISPIGTRILEWFYQTAQRFELMKSHTRYASSLDSRGYEGSTKGFNFTPTYLIPHAYTWHYHDEIRRMTDRYRNLPFDYLSDDDVMLILGERRIVVQSKYHDVRLHRQWNILLRQICNKKIV